MTDTTSVQPPAPVKPTAKEIEAALRVLAKAWAPEILLPGDPGYDEADDSIDPDEYCGCGGTDEDGESYCNCGDACVCDSCEYFRYARNNRCWVKDCGKTPAFRVVRFGLADQHVQEPTARGAVCPHPEGAHHYCTPDTVYLAAGPSVQEYSHHPACSMAHAAQVRSSLQKHHRGADYLFRIEAWTYTPHDQELPEPLPQLRRLTDGAHDSVKWAVKGYAAKRDTGHWLDSARRKIALAAFHAHRELQPLDTGDDVDDEPSTPPQEEPDWPDSGW